MIILAQGFAATGFLLLGVILFIIAITIGGSR